MRISANTHWFNPPQPPPTETDKQEERQLDTNLPRSLPQGFVAGVSTPLSPTLRCGADVSLPSQLWSDWQSLLAIFRGAHDWRFWQAWFVPPSLPPPPFPSLPFSLTYKSLSIQDSPSNWCLVCIISFWLAARLWYPCFLLSTLYRS